ncbi:two pore domain potassium channel family protein [Virgibacillus necropolis]|uniref:potassium channel family protein n=1 Tax=Virgibacillus necropolis TaxID=163877 RepID=UPI00384CF7CC
MTIVSWIFISIVSVTMVGSIAYFMRHSKNHERSFSMEIFYTLLVVYSIVIIGFALIYFILSFHRILLVEGEELRQVSVLGSFIHSMYFSGVTMLTIGYGDITPIGYGRLIALIQALIGYILPTAFVLRLVQNKQDD